MHCNQARRQIADLFQPSDATLALTGHLSECTSCRSLFEEKKMLHAAIAQLRAETAGLSPSDGVEERVLAALNASPGLTGPRTAMWSRAAVSALAVATVICTALILGHRTTKVLPAQSAVTLVNDGFTEMPYVIPPAPYERTTVVRTELPLQVMIAAGFQVYGEDLDSSTLADVVYGEDGRILAVRLVPQPDNSSDERTN
jgi:hypothetical protein